MEQGEGTSENAMAESASAASSTESLPFGNLLAQPGLLANPYPLYAMLRANNPVLKVPIPNYDGPGVVVLTRFAEIETVLRDDRYSVDRAKADVLRLVPDDLVRELIDGPNAFRSMLTQDC